MVEMAGKEYLLKLREKQAQMRKEMLKLFTGNVTLSFQDVYLKMEGRYHQYCPSPYGRDRILEGVVKNELSILVSRRKLAEISTKAGVGYCIVAGDNGQKTGHAA